jgi:hypothetical protein
MNYTDRFLYELASCFLAGPWNIEDMARRGLRVCTCEPTWLRALVEEVLEEYPDATNLPTRLRLTASLQYSCTLGDVPDEELDLFRTPRMRPVGSADTWRVPSLVTEDQLADFLGLYPDELPWLADVHGLEVRVPAGPLRHYVYRSIRKANGRSRLIEMPKSLLKGTQQRILHHLLDRIPPHDSAHAFRKGRSIATFAAPHCGHQVVLRFDLKDFFPSVPASRVHRVFRTAGYPREIARLLTGLCTNVVPDDVWSPEVPWTQRQRFRSPHLPQGAPTSPALANLCARRLDARLTGLACAAGATYTRYADDLAFSGGAELRRAARRFHVLVATIALEEGFEVNTAKTRVLRRGVRQQLAGVVVNDHPNVQRTEYDRLRAILCNCVRNGPAGENREGHANFRAHLLGRIAHVAMLNPARGTKLRELFSRIEWK